MSTVSQDDSPDEFAGLFQLPMYQILVPPEEVMKQLRGLFDTLERRLVPCIVMNFNT
jgi:hypothetical protein